MDDAPEIRNKPPSSRTDALAVLKRLREEGYTAYFAGGCVRDLLVGLEAKDYDIATDAPPQRVRELFRNTQAVGAAFGVILVRHGQSVIEVATFRTERDYRDGRRPAEVSFATAEEDARRRDFSINGLFLDPLSDQVIDHVGGLEDLSLRRVRAIGDPHARFEEDHLRLLRAVRFSSRFGFEIEPATAAAISTHALKLKRISPERIAEELRLMLTPPTRTDAWKMLHDLALIDVIFRFLPAETPRGTGFQPVQRGLFEAVAPERSIAFSLALAAGSLCHLLRAGPATDDVRPLLARNAVHAMVRAMRQALRISNEEADEMADTLLGLEPLLADDPPTRAIKLRFLARPTSAMSRDLMDALSDIGLHSDRINALRDELAGLEKTDVAPPPLITGDDLIAAGMTPGPLFKRLLDHVYDAQLERRIATRDEALKLAVELARNP